ncbi:MAG: hypothetical protein ACJAUG_001163 [Halioglobus sp.]|jgi:hypothetical protein
MILRELAAQLPLTDNRCSPLVLGDNPSMNTDKRGGLQLGLPTRYHQLRCQPRSNSPVGADNLTVKK